MSILTSYLNVHVGGCDPGFIIAHRAREEKNNLPIYPLGFLGKGKAVHSMAQITITISTEHGKLRFKGLSE